MALLVVFGYSCFAVADLPSINGPAFQTQQQQGPNKTKKPVKNVKLKNGQTVMAVPPPPPPQQVFDPARETSIDRIVVGIFSANVADKQLAANWNKYKFEIQKTFLALLNERSYLDAVPINKEFALTENKDVISYEAQRDGVDGALVGEFRGKSLELAIRSGATGRTMARMSIPIPDLAATPLRDIVSPAVDQVILSFPYRGFVVARKDNEVKLNLGKAEGIKPGTILEIDELEFDQAL